MYEGGRADHVHTVHTVSSVCLVGGLGCLVCMGWYNLEKVKVELLVWGLVSGLLVGCRGGGRVQ